mmetsp:Transcript_63506/g.151430  ORF Transcript_63506/g.151430 Transcript_63506/m.151430 type:complete len:214 (-) Transcript_63506:12-653(-)
MWAARELISVFRLESLKIASQRLREERRTDDRPDKAVTAVGLELITSSLTRLYQREQPERHQAGRSPPFRRDDQDLPLQLQDGRLKQRRRHFRRPPRKQRASSSGSSRTGKNSGVLHRCTPPKSSTTPQSPSPPSTSPEPGIPCSRDGDGNQRGFERLLYLFHLIKGAPPRRPSGRMGQPYVPGSEVQSGPATAYPAPCLTLAAASLPQRVNI